MQFEMNWAPLLVRLMRELRARTFRILHNYTFLVSIPKWREIFATEFVGRLQARNPSLLSGLLGTGLPGLGAEHLPGALCSVTGSPALGLCSP